MKKGRSTQKGEGESSAPNDPPLTPPPKFYGHHYGPLIFLTMKGFCGIFIDSISVKQ